jgi:hypothetical protein
MQSSFLTSRANSSKRSLLNQQFQYNLSLQMLCYCVITIFSSPEQALTCFRLEEKIHQKKSSWRRSNKTKQQFAGGRRNNQVRTYIEAIANKLQHTSSSNAERSRRRAYSLSVATLCLRIPASSPKSRNNGTLEEEAKKGRRIAHQTLSPTITREEETKHRSEKQKRDTGETDSAREGVCPIRPWANNKRGRGGRAGDERGFRRFLLSSSSSIRPRVLYSSNVQHVCSSKPQCLFLGKES